MSLIAILRTEIQMVSLLATLRAMLVLKEVKALGTEDVDQSPYACLCQTR